MSEAAIRYADLRAIERSLSTIVNAQGQLESQVQSVASTQDATRNELQELRAKFEHFIRQDQMAKALQLAQTQIIEVRQELETKFGHYALVRRNATGLLQGMDAGIVSHGTMQQISEELMVSTPRYWLAPALVALAAWIRNDQQLAERALAEAIRRDNDKTSLFFALVTRRNHRSAATARWLTQYIIRQDPSKLSREYTVVLDAVAQGALGPESKPVTMQHMRQWYDQLTRDDDVVAAQVKRWMELIDGLRSPVDPRYTILPVVSSTWPALKDVYEGATVHARAEDHFRQLFETPVVPNPDLARRVDDILTSLVSNFDLEEAPFRKKEAELREIIDHGGDKDAAKAAADAEAPVHQPTVDFLTLLTNAAFFPEQSGASKGTQLFAIALARDWIVEADRKLEAQNLQKMPAGVSLEIEGWQSAIDGSATEDQLTASLGSHIDRETQAKVASIKLRGGAIAGGVIGVLGFIFAIVAFASGSAGGGIFLLLAAAGGGGFAFNEYRQIPHRREDAWAQGRQRKAQAVAQLKGAVAEVVDWRNDWQIQHQLAPHFVGYMQTLNAESLTVSAPDVAREVLRKNDE